MHSLQPAGLVPDGQHLGRVCSCCRSPRATRPPRRDRDPRQRRRHDRPRVRALLPADARSTRVEIDGELTDIGRRYFDMRGPRLRTHTADARPFLRRTKQRYDAIFVDAYRQPYIPFYLATREFFELARDRLRPGGVVLVNVGHPERLDRLEQVLGATMGAVFATVLRDPSEDDEHAAARRPRRRVGAAAARRVRRRCRADLRPRRARSRRAPRAAAARRARLHRRRRAGRVARSTRRSSRSRPRGDR